MKKKRDSEMDEFIIEDEPINNGLNIAELPNVDEMELMSAQKLESKLDEQIEAIEREQNFKNRKRERQEKQMDEKDNAEASARDDDENDELTNTPVEKVREEIYNILAENPDWMEEIRKTKPLINLSKMNKDGLFSILSHLRSKMNTGMSKRVGDASVNTAVNLMATRMPRLRKKDLLESLKKDEDFTKGVYYGWGRLMGKLPYVIRIPMLGLCHVFEHLSEDAGDAQEANNPFVSKAK